MKQPNTGAIELMSPKIDFAFKLIFGNENHKDITIAFLSDILGLPRSDFVDLEFTNTELLRLFKEDKKGILDVRVKTRDKRQINIEIQILPTDFMPPRSLFYWAKMFVSQIRAGDTYDKIRKCIAINIVDFECTPLKQLHSRYHLLEDATGHQLTDMLEMHFLELPKLHQADVSCSEDDPVVQWMLFISSKSQEVMNMLAQKNNDIGQAFNVLQILSQDETMRMAYEAREAELMDQRTRIKSAHKEGWGGGQLNILARLLTRRFGPLPDDVQQRLKKASTDQVEQWAERLLDADTLETLLEP